MPSGAWIFATTSLTRSIEKRLQGRAGSVEERISWHRSRNRDPRTRDTGDCKDAAAEASTGDAPDGGVGINPDQGPDPIIYAIGPNAAFSY